MKSQIQKLGIFSHQICYEVTLPDGRTNVLKTLPKARKWAEREEAKLTEQNAIGSDCDECHLSKGSHEQPTGLSEPVAFCSAVVEQYADSEADYRNQINLCR